jgi:hypothetical protein
MKILSLKKSNHTIVTYSYTDAGNYKFYGYFCVSDKFSVSEISHCLIQNQYFVPAKVGLPTLVPCFRNSDDHLLHEFVSTDYFKSEKVEFMVDKKKFINLTRTAKNMGWFRNINSTEHCY